MPGNVCKLLFYLRSAKTVLCSWCQPCRVLTPLLKRVTGPESNYDLLTINVDDYPEVAAKYKVSALPTVVAFKNGAVKNKFGTLQDLSVVPGLLMRFIVGFRGQDDINKFLGML